MRFRTEIAAVQTADPVLKSGRAAGRRIARTVAGVIPAGEADPCAAYEAYAGAGYPERAGARGARARPAPGGDRDRPHRAQDPRRRPTGCAQLGLSRADARAFRQLAD